MSEVRIYRDLCKGVEGCGICLSVCRQNVFTASLTQYPKGYRPPEVAKMDSCTGCEDCMISCPDLAIAVAGKRRQKSVRT